MLGPRELLAHLANVSFGANHTLTDFGNVARDAILLLFFQPVKFFGMAGLAHCSASKSATHAMIPRM
jgi:hypothetical protein